MLRSSSPAPSISPSIDTVPLPAWKDLDPLSPPSSTEKRATTQSRSRGSGTPQSDTPASRRSQDEGNALSTFSPGRGSKSQHSGPSSDGEDESLAKTRKSKASMFSRVFRGDSTAMARSSVHGRSESTDLLYPEAQAASPASTPGGRRGSSIPRAKTPPIRPSTFSEGGGGKNGSFKRKNKNRRPISLNIPIESSSTEPKAPPPTLNNLGADARADLIRKNRKLQQMLGKDYYNAAGGAAAHRSTKSEDAGPIGGLVQGMASLSKKAGRSGLALAKTGMSTGDMSPSRNPQRAYSETNTPTETMAPRSALSVTSSHILLNQGSAVDDSNAAPKRIPAARLTKAKSPSPSKPGRPTHLGLRSRSFSASTSTLSTIPATPDSFIDFSSDAGELFTTPTSAGGSRNRPFRIITPDTLQKNDIADGAATPGISTAHTNERSITPRPADDGEVPALDSPRTERADKRLSLNHRSSSTPPGTPLSANAHPRRPLSVSSISTIEASLLVDQEALDRKRRRDRLVKLHRYLGSNVPVGAILGTQPPGEEGLPAPADDDEDDEATKWWKKQKAGMLEEDEDQLQLPRDTMTDQERVLNVKRKAKMEQVFGEHPPQGLYVVRTAPNFTEAPLSDDSLPAMASSPSTAGLASLEFLRHSHSLDSLSYLVDKDDAVSLRNLFVEISKEDPAEDMEEEIVFAPPEHLDEDDDTDDPVISHQHRLHQRHQIRRKSLPLNVRNRGAGSSLSSPTSPLSHTGISPTSPVYPRANRNSTSSFASIEVEPVDPFQQRRKRAAKLTKFFGTDHRSLFGEVLESIETGVKDDRHKGSLTEEESQELLRKLRNLRAKQSTIKQHTTR